MVLEDKTTAIGSETTLTCSISDLSSDTPVIWIGPDENQISQLDSSNYVVDQGTFLDGNKESTLLIKLLKMQSLSSSSNFKCQLKSALYPTHSPDVQKQMTLTVLSLSMVIFSFELSCSFIDR